MPVLRYTPFSALLAACLVTALLYLGKPFLLPFAISILLAFLLAPLVARLESWGLGRVVSVSVVTLLTFAVVVLGFYIVAGQLVDLVSALPGYRENLRLKIFAPLQHFSSVFATLANDLQPPAEPASQVGAMPVEVVSGKFTLFGVVRDLAGPLLAPLGAAAIVLVNVVFFLFDRQSLRDRFIHLVGRGRLHVTTQAIDDAASRVSRYLGAQLVVNASYAVPIGLGLFFIGIPNSALWGFLAFLFRFIPYLGAWIAAALPIALSLAISPSWTPPLATVALFIGMELFSNNVIEPWLYGASTGLSPSAIIVSATFWTWLWGLGGLLLATPLTVCFVVLGKYVPALSFLDILLGDHPPIAPEHRFYQRLLAGDQEELDKVISDHIKRDAAPQLFDKIILPALQLAEQDVRSGSLEPEEQKEICRQLREALGSIDGFRLVDDEQLHGIAIIPARTECDALAGAMLAHVLRARGLACTLFSELTLASEVQARLAAKPNIVLCLSAFTPSAARTAGTIFKRLGVTAGGLKVLGFWHGDRKLATERVNHTGTEVATSLAEAVRIISSSTAEPLRGGASVPDASAKPSNDGAI